VEACSTGQTATLQTGTACEDRDAEADSQGIEANAQHRENDAGGLMLFAKSFTNASQKEFSEVFRNFPSLLRPLPPFNDRAFVLARRL